MSETFKKVYYDETMQRAVSKFVQADDLVVPYSANSLEDAEAISGYDRYVITFPKTRRSLVEALGANVVEESAFTTTVEEAIAQQKGSTQPLDGSTYQADKLNNVSVRPANSTYAILKTYLFPNTVLIRKF